MAETTTEVRADIESTRARMAGAIAELERKADVAERVREHPWTALALAFGAGLVLSGSGADVKAAQATTAATKGTRTKLGGALDGVLAAVIAGAAGAFHSRVEEMVTKVVPAVRKPAAMHDVGPVDRTEASMRAD
jgi:hypothetical protein